MKAKGPKNTTGVISQLYHELVTKSLVKAKLEAAAESERVSIRIVWWFCTSMKVIRVLVPAVFHGASCRKL